MQHKLLVRQMRRCLGVSSEAALQIRLDRLRAGGDAALADGLEKLFKATEQSYVRYERDLMLRKRLLERSAEQLRNADAQLCSATARQRSGALASAENANRRILDNLREVVFQTDVAGRWVGLNPAWATITGFEVGASLGQRALSYIHPHDQSANRAGLRALIARGETYFRGRMRFRTSADGYRWLEVLAHRIDDEHGRACGVSGSLIDITEQKEAQDQLVVSQARLHQTLLATNTRLWDWDWDMTQSQPTVDPAWFLNLGYAPDDPGLRSIQWVEQIHPQDLARWRDHLRDNLRGARLEIDIDLRFMHQDGTWRHASLRGKVVAWRGKQALRIAGMLQDISARKEAEQEVKRQQELTEQILDQLPIPVFLKDRQGRFLRFNRQFEQFSHVSRAEMLGHTIEQFSSRRWAGVTQAEDAMAWRSGQMVTSERHLTNVDPPIDMLVNRIVINSGGESYLLGFSIDVSEQRAARDAMQRAVESAEAASRAKSEFLANMSHEIRTPMNGILGMTELVLESPLNPDQRADIALVKASADALLTIINDILDFSKIEAGKLDIEEVPFDLRKLVTDCVKSIALQAHQKSLELVCDLPDNLPRVVRGDPGRLRQVLLNLLSNALKFTQQGRIVVTLGMGPDTQEGCDIAFLVSDTGIGIPLDKQNLIFEAFSQVDGSTTRQYGGTGLGLTICRRLVILMQGRLEVISAPGVGSTFSFTVPLRQTGVPAQELEGGLALSGREKGEPAPFGSSAPGSAAPHGQSADQGVGLRILLAEDNPVNQRLALRLLEKQGHRITLVDNGLAALERNTCERFDLILMDVQMPGLDGLAATGHIRRWEATHGGHVPIVAMTARAMQGDRERCLEAGMDDYLSKPIDSARLRQMLEQFGADPSEPVLEWRAALLRLDGDAELLLELAAIFLDDGPVLLLQLRAALDAGQPGASERAVHSLKGVLLNFGAQRAIAVADRLATSLQEPAPSQQWRCIANELGPALEQVYQALRERLTQGEPGDFAP